MTIETLIAVWEARLKEAEGQSRNALKTLSQQCEEERRTR